MDQDRRTDYLYLSELRKKLRLFFMFLGFSLNILFLDKAILAMDMVEINWFFYVWRKKTYL